MDSGAFGKKGHYSVPPCSSASVENLYPVLSYPADVFSKQDGRMDGDA